MSRRHSVLDAAVCWCRVVVACRHDDVISVVVHLPSLSRAVAVEPRTPLNHKHSSYTYRRRSKPPRPGKTLLDCNPFCSGRTEFGGNFFWKLALTRTPDHIRPTRWGPDPNRPSTAKKGVMTWGFYPGGGWSSWQHECLAVKLWHTCCQAGAFMCHHPDLWVLLDSTQSHISKITSALGLITIWEGFVRSGIMSVKKS